MRSITIKTWTRWFLSVVLCVCMFSQSSCAKEQTPSVFYSIDSVEDTEAEQEVDNNTIPSYVFNQGRYIDTLYMSRDSLREAQKIALELNNDITKGSTQDKSKDSTVGSTKDITKEITYDSKGTTQESSKVTADGVAKESIKDTDAIQTIIEENSTITLMFTGDLMCLGGQQKVVNKKGMFDFTASFTYVKPLFQNADIVIGNLETLISPSNPYTYQEKTKGSNPNCNAMESYLKALVDAGFDAVVTANNHALDGDVIGITETIEKLDENNLVHTGTFLDQQEQSFILYEAKGITVAILSYTELINARNTLPSSQVESLISCYSKDKVMRDVKAAKESGANYIVAYNHWGVENTHEVTALQKQHANQMAEAGVDLIIGSHPHCLQEATYITTSDGRQVLCIYSMGNFVSSMTREINSDTIVLEVNLHRNKDIVYPGAIGYFPMKVISSYQNMSYVILPVSKHLNQYSNLQPKLEQTRIRIKKVIGSEISEIRY